ncbi:MAG: ribonuclease H-like domain-containing protein [Anaerolineae bacterium]|nr:ribonuclease H-like domain-containing protein [Anaerolineae bacterium]
MDAKLHRRLKRLGVVRGTRNLNPPPLTTPAGSTPKPPRCPAALPGEEVATDAGPVWVARRHYPADIEHGRYRLHELQTVSQHALTLLGTPDLGDYPAFLDTETTGLAGGAGTLAFLIGVGVWTVEGLTLHMVFLRDPADERAALHYIERVLAPATGLVTFNGNGFDLPLLENRFILQRLLPRWQRLPHLDLLPVARLLWRDHLSSRRLGVLETELLAITRTEEDLPSWMIPEAYRAYLSTGDPSEMARIFYHNEIDILSLATLLIHAARCVDSPETLGVAATEWVGIGRLYARADLEAQAQAAWRRALDLNALPVEVAARLWRELALQKKRSEAWDKALDLWETWARCIPDAIEPLIERAKYFEWVARDFAAALLETESALRRIPQLSTGFLQESTQAELLHRRERLWRKLHRSNETNS